MKRALVAKELRECLPLVSLAALAAAWALYIYTGGLLLGAWSPIVWDPQPYLPEDDFLDGPVTLIVGGLALLLGLKQTAWEDLRGTYAYLLHRPMTRRQLMLVKAGVGVALVQILGAGMLLIYALWAATPGTHASPFSWSMTIPGWQLWCIMPIVYLSAMLCGLRPARWYGSRLLPLVPCGLLAALLAMLPWPWMSVIGSLASCAVLLGCIHYVAATRDY
jgi:hypothetical protein